MDCTAQKIPYRQTGNFSKLVLDYIDQTSSVKNFFSHPPTISGIKNAIKERKKIDYNRRVLADVLKEQYAGMPQNEKVNKNIEALLSPGTFTVTTAHQTNIFSGPLYFIYKIIHVIKLAEYLNASIPENKFVPVFFVGSEDADLDELNHIYLGGQKIEWKTAQTGAVGRMQVDKEITQLISQMEGQLSVQPFGNRFIELLKSCYKEGDTIQLTTFRLVHALFAEYGLVVLLPDHPLLKKEMIAVFEDDLIHQSASGIVEKTATSLSEAGYKVQANPREINLFYLKDDLRERIKVSQQGYSVVNTDKQFTKEELLNELRNHPGRFSPNVILRGIFQETVLPNIAFVGGGGETAYWLQLKNLFDHYKTPFPVLVLRNSFLIIEKKWKEKMAKLQLDAEDFFLPESAIVNKLVTRESKQEIKLNGSLLELEQLYEGFKKQAASIDSSLEKHVESLKLSSVKRLQQLEKKMLRAEKRKYKDHQRQVQHIKENLFPGNGLQERHENISYFYSLWGNSIIKNLHANSLHFEHEFVILTEK